MGVTRFGKYELLSKLGQGGMAETYRAQLKGAAGVVKPLVIKKVLPELARQSELVEAFISEARISASLSHGNIAQVFDFGEAQGQYYLAMEWVHGKSLAHVIDRAASKGFWHLPFPIAAFIAAEVLKGLHHAHTRKGDDGRPLHLVHRDVTPDNVLLSFEGEVKVADFGIAKAQLSGRKETQVGLVKGKFLYFSPEQATGKAVDARTDVYATGVCLYQMLTGQLPFSGPYQQVMPGLVAGQYRRVSELNPEVPPELEAIVDQAMVKDLTARFRTALQMLEALTSWLSANAPSFSGQRLKLLLDALYEPELEREGERPVFDHRAKEQHAAWKPAARAPALPRSEPKAVDVTQSELPPVPERSASRGLTWVAIAVTAIIVLVGGGVAVQLAMQQPTLRVDAAQTLGGGPPQRPPHRPARAVEAEVPVAPAKAREPEVVLPAVDESRRPLKLLADTHLVVRRPARTQWKALLEDTVYRVSLITPGPVLGETRLEFEDAAGRQLVPIKPGETIQVKQKVGMGVSCDPGPRALVGEQAFVMLISDGRSERLLIDPRQCVDFEQAKRVELEAEKRYVLSVPADASAELGPQVPLAVGWRARLRQEGFLAGTLAAGERATIDGAVFLEVGFVDGSASDNRGAVEVVLEEAKGDTEVHPGTIAVVADSHGVPVPYAESLENPLVKRARALMQAGRVPEVLSTIAPCLKSYRPVPECFRLEGEAYVRLDQPARAEVSYRRFLEFPEDGNPGRRVVKMYLDGRNAQ